MYQVASVLGLPVTVNAQWQAVEFSGKLVKDLYQAYRRFIVTLTNPQMEAPIHVDFEVFRNDYGNYNNTLAVMIAGLGDNYGFTPMDKLPNGKVGYLTYNRADSAGYQLRLGKCGVNLPENASLDLKTDIRLSRPGIATDFSDFTGSVLASVNGFLHRVDYDGNFPYVVDGGTSVQLAKNNQVGLYSFESLGKIDVVPLTEAMISIPEPFTTLKERVMITFPEDKPLNSYLLVLGGYLVVPQQEVLWRLNDHQLLLDVNRLNLHDRILESRDFIDLKPMDFTEIETNPNAFDTTELYSDVGLKKYLALSQSFLIRIDTDNLFHNRITLRQFDVPGIFSTVQEPIYPLQLGTGRWEEYWKEQDANHWAVHLADNYRRMWMHYREKIKDYPVIFDQLSFNNPYYFSQGFLMEIGSYQNEE